jgi:hypothetical protein
MQFALLRSPLPGIPIRQYVALKRRLLGTSLYRKQLAARLAE